MQQRLARKRRRQVTRMLIGFGLMGFGLVGTGLGAAWNDFPGTASAATATTTPKNRTKTPAPTPKPVAKPAPPAAAPVPPAGFQQMSQLAFLTGSWVGHLKAMPIFMDISINGAAEQVGGPIKFKIRATPPANSFMKLGLEGDYNAVAAYSATQKAVRAVLTDATGHGVEMIGEPDTKPTDWLFNSTAQGAPFPFKVRVTSISANEVLVNYSSGGRMPLKYEVTFNRVEG